MTATPPDFGVIHTRAMRLSPDGRALDGEDTFAPADGRALPRKAGDEYAIRFHLHPAVKASRLADGYGVLLLLPDREMWRFSTYGDTVEIEESVFLAGSDGPRRTVQIVIYGHARQQAEGALVLPPYAAGGTAAPRPGRGAGTAAVAPPSMAPAARHPEPPNA